MVSLVDTNKTASLTIHKYLGDPTGAPAQGIDQTVTGPTPYDAQFRVRKILNLMPSKMADWEAYTKLDPKNIDKTTLGAEKLVTTTGGVGALTGLELGFYYIEEVPAASDDIATNDASGRSTIAPFLAALPMTRPNSTEWNYDVHVHPKNQELKVTKTVKDLGENIGDKVSYTIDGTVPAPPTQVDKMLDYYQLVDTFDKDELTFDGTATVSITGTGGAALTADTDYVLSPVADKSGDATKSQFTVTLTKSGLTKLTAARKADPATTVQLRADFTLSKLTDGVETNTATLNPPSAHPIDQEATNVVPEAPKDVTPPPESTVESRHGIIELTKVDGNKQDTKLKGAKFELYKCNSGTIDLQSKDKVSVGGETSWETDDNGLATISGVQVEDYADGATITDTFDYCVVETKAPAGYELNTKPIPVSVTSASPKTPTTPYKTTATVLNYPTNGGFKLPETGAAGVAGLIAGGGLIAALAVFMNRRKAGRAEQQLLGS